MQRYDGRSGASRRDVDCTGLGRQSIRHGHSGIVTGSFIHLSHRRSSFRRRPIRELKAFSRLHARSPATSSSSGVNEMPVSASYASAKSVGGMRSGSVAGRAQRDQVRGVVGPASCTRSPVMDLEEEGPPASRPLAAMAVTGQDLPARAGRSAGRGQCGRRTRGMTT